MGTSHYLATSDLYRWVDMLVERFHVLGPVPAKRGQHQFARVNNSDDLDLSYCNTMTSPRCFGCIGCGRCMTWCPTEIDITDMAKRSNSIPRDNWSRCKRRPDYWPAVLRVGWHGQARLSVGL